MPILEEIQAAIENGRPKDAERLISRAVEEGIRPSVILEEAMITAMRNAGEYYRNNDGDIPRILAAARSMRKGLNILEPYLEKDKVCFLGTVLLGTIEGDLHDVGKNLVAMMFRSAGFHVIDLGVDVSEKQFLKASSKLKTAHLKLQESTSFKNGYSTYNSFISVHMSKALIKPFFIHLSKK